MGLLDFFQRKPPLPDAPEALRERLFELAARGDATALANLCRARRDVILRHFPEWKIIPEPMRNDRVAVERYAGRLFTVAAAFQKELGDDQLVRVLQSAPEDSPLAKWDPALARARGLMEQARYDEARDLLNDLLIDVRDLVSFGAMSHHGLTHGLLGHCLFSSGHVGDAKAHFERALALCAEQGDREGVRAYVGSLYEVHRYLGEPAAAADYGLRYARILREQGEGAEAQSWEDQARLVAAGEPLNRVVAVVGDHRFELDQVPTAPRETTMHFHFVRNRPSLRLAEQLIEEGGRLGGAGDYYGALDAFRRAAKVDPFDPQPRYQQAVTLMHLDRAAEAAEAYAVTDALAPGWFNCRAEGWLAAQVAAGAVPQAIFLLLRLEDVSPESVTLEDRLKYADKALDNLPRLAPLHLFHGRTLEAMQRPADAATAYHAGLDCVEVDDDTRSRLLLHLYMLADKGAESRRFLAEAAALHATGNLMAVSMATIALRASDEARRDG
jgi:tetratricopeptide (TPR) repeat protein